MIIDMSGADGLGAVDDPFTDLPPATFFVAPGGYDGSHNVFINQEEKFGSAFLGQWGIYAFPGSDTIIASDINNGLIVMKMSDEPCKGMKCSK